MHRRSSGENDGIFKIVSHFERILFQGKNVQFFPLLTLYNYRQILLVFSCCMQN